MKLLDTILFLFLIINIANTVNCNDNGSSGSKCSNDSIYPFDKPILINIISSIKNKHYNKHHHDINRDDTGDKYYKISIDGRACFSFDLQNKNNTIFEISKESLNNNNTISSIPKKLLKLSKFKCRIVNLNIRGEILSFEQVQTKIQYNKQTKIYKIQIYQHIMHPQQQEQHLNIKMNY